MLKEHSRLSPKNSQCKVIPFAAQTDDPFYSSPTLGGDVGEEDSFDVRALDEGDGGVGRNGIQIPSQGATGPLWTSVDYWEPVMAWNDIPLMLMLSAFKEMDFTEHCDHLKFLLGIQCIPIYVAYTSIFWKGRSVLQV